MTNRDTFKLLIHYCQEKEGVAAERITMTTLSGNLINRFLGWLEKERKCSISTRNQRLAAIHSFFRYAQCEDPSGLYHFQEVIAIPVKKQAKQLWNILHQRLCSSCCSNQTKRHSAGGVT